MIYTLIIGSATGSCELSRDRLIAAPSAKLMLRAFGWYVLQRHYCGQS
jgi:hypothetical protein